MKYISAYLLALTASNATPTAESVEKILDSIGVAVESKRIEQLLSELDGKDVQEIIAIGRSKMASIGTSIAPLEASGNSNQHAVNTVVAEDEEKQEESDEDDFGISLFDD